MLKKTYCWNQQQRLRRKLHEGNHTFDDTTNIHLDQQVDKFKITTNQNSKEPSP